jgi:PAS domain S-box-containing protein
LGWRSSCIYLSKQWYEITGRTPSQDLGFGWVENTHPDDREAASKAFFTAVEAKGRISIQYRLRLKDGRYRWAVDTGLPRHSETGEFLGYIGTVIDIHDQISTEEELIGLQRRFERTAAATQFGVWYCDLPFDVLIWNKEVKEHFFMPPDALVTIDDFYNHIHPADLQMTKEAIRHSIDSKAPYDIKYRTIDPDDSRRVKYIRAIGWTDYDKSGTPIRFDGVTMDVTKEHFRGEELRLKQIELEKAKLAAERASEAKSLFLANMSHEIRTPLGAIVGFSELLKSAIEDNSEAEDLTLRISRNSDLLNRLVDDLLDLSKIEANSLHLASETFDLTTTIEEAIEIVEYRAREKNLGFNVLGLNQLKDQVVGDSTRIKQIVINLVGNAVKFTEKGKVTVEFQANQRKGRKTIQMRVSDTGIGLPQESQAFLFRSFSQADPSVSRRYGGTGLGLALSKSLACLMGGDVVLESSVESRGSVFLLTLDLQLGDASHAASGATLESESSVDMGQFCVLVVDDAPDNLALVSKVLLRYGFRCDKASSGKECLSKVRGGTFDLILLDLQMPEMDGYATYEKLRAEGVKIPIIALTAHALKSDRERCLAVGFDDYLSKPIAFKELVKKIKELLPARLIET